jgi:proline iminopeptidase
VSATQSSTGSQVGVSHPADEHIRSSRPVLLAIDAALAATSALVAAALTPRGPSTTTNALMWMAGLLVVGFVAGVLTGTRWSLILTPTVFVAVFELARLGTQGPTVDAVHIDSTYGIIAFVVGRGLTFFLAVPSMVVGAAIGVGVAGHRGHPGVSKLGRVAWVLTGVAAAALVALAVVIARPASTAPILGSDGASPVGSIAMLTSVPIGGHDQALLIRGRSVESPVLLHLAGGPGGTDLGAMRADTTLEQGFVVVTWEQRGVGKSYSALDPVETLTLAQVVADTIELSEYLAERFDEERIYLTGNSWGATLGVLAVQQRPDLYHAWVGSGQMVSQRATDIMFWEDTVAWAEATGASDLAARLRANGPPPYADILDYEIALSHEHDWNPYPEWDGDSELPATLFVPENEVMDQVNGLRSFLDTFSVLYPQLQGIDFRRDVPSLGVPVYLVTGAHEARGRAVPAREWFELLDAPSKEWIVFEHSGHRPSFEEPGVFAALMARVRDETYAVTGVQ